MDELISPKDIDPIHRYVPRQDQRNVSMRYSNQVSWLVEFSSAAHINAKKEKNNPNHL